MRDSAAHHIIQGNFAPARSSRILGITARVFSLLFGLFVVGALILYGIKVHYEDAINKVARDTRDLNEQNKELQVKLNHIRSFKNVEAAATQVPHLHMAETVIDIPPSAQVQLPTRPEEPQEFPRVYGY
jgi:outer membrane murein-binding lipoprotein Lpp